MLTPRIGDDFGDGGAIAQAEIESLRADRRHDMRGFADQRDAAARKGLGGLDRQRKNAAARLDAHFAEHANARGARSRPTSASSSKRRQRGRCAGIEHANKARALAGQGHEREWAAFGVKFGRCVVDAAGHERD